MGEAPDPNTVIVDPREGGQKLLQFLQRRLDLPPSLLHRWIRTGQVRINGGRAKPFGLVAAGDSVRLPPFALGMSRRSKATGGQASPEQEHEPRQRTQALPPAPRPLQKDGDLWVFCKPAGLPTHPGTGHEDSLSSRLAARAGDAPFKPTPVHRLDKDTSGILLVAATGINGLAMTIFRAIQLPLILFTMVTLGVLLYAILLLTDRNIRAIRHHRFRLLGSLSVDITLLPRLTVVAVSGAVQKLLVPWLLSQSSCFWTSPLQELIPLPLMTSKPWWLS